MSYTHLSRCVIGNWQGLFRGVEDERVDVAIREVEKRTFNIENVLRCILLADFLFHKILFPESKAKRVRAIKNKLKAPKRRFSPSKWLDDKETYIDEMLELLKHPVRDEQGTIEVGPFTLQNPIHLEDEKVKRIEAAVENALKKCTNSLVPNFTQMLYGDVTLVEKMGRANWFAWYSPTKDEITIKFMEREEEEFTRTFIHEIGHRYYQKILSREKKSFWVEYHKSCKYFDHINLRDWIGVDIGLYAKKKRTRTNISPRFTPGSRPVTIKKITFRGVYLNDEEGVLVGPFDPGWLVDVIKARSGVFPSTYASTDEEEHFCEALAYKAIGSLDAKVLEAFNSIVLEGKRYQPKSVDLTPVVEAPVVEAPVEISLPSKVEMIRTSESLASRLGLVFNQGRKYGLFVYTNSAVGSTHAYMFIDYATGNLFAPKSKALPNLKINLANISDNNLDVNVGFERMSNLRPRWRTMNMITEPTQEASPTEVVDQTPEPTIPTTPEGNTQNIIEASKAIADSLGMTIKVLKSVIIFLYQNEETQSTHTYLVVDKSNGYIHPPRHKVLPKRNVSLGSVFEPNILSKVNTDAMKLIQPAWRTKYKHPKRIR